MTANRHESSPTESWHTGETTGRIAGPLATDMIVSKIREDDYGSHYDLLAATKVLADFDRDGDRGLFAFSMLHRGHRIDLRDLFILAPLAVGQIHRRHRRAD